MRCLIRPFVPADINGAVALFAAYMHELFNEPSALTADVILRDGQGLHFSLMLAVHGRDGAVGFAAWRRTYDLHHAARGGEICDLFVMRPYRGRALALRLAAGVAKAVRQWEGVFLKGDAVPRDAARLRLLGRLTVGFPLEHVYLSGAAFRRVAELADVDLRTLIANLPSRDANREP